MVILLTSLSSPNNSHLKLKKFALTVRSLACVVQIRSQKHEFEFSAPMKKFRSQKQRPVVVFVLS
jgi:hypothetical protein